MVYWACRGISGLVFGKVEFMSPVLDVDRKLPVALVDLVNLKKVFNQIFV